MPKIVYLIGIYLALGYAAGLIHINHDSILELQLLVSLVPFALIGLLLGRAMRADAGFRKIGLLPRHPLRDLKWGVVGGILCFGLATVAGYAAIGLFYLLDEPIPNLAHDALQSLSTDFSFGRLMFLVFTAVILAPLVEEMTFRGVLQTSFMRLLNGQRWIAIVLTAAVFSVIHGNVVPTHGLVPLFVLGVMWGALYERTGSLLTPILAHAVFNAVNIAITLSLTPQ